VASSLEMNGHPVSIKVWLIYLYLVFLSLWGVILLRLGLLVVMPPFTFLFQNLHQMSASLLEMLDDPDESTREFALSLLAEILEKQVGVFYFWWDLRLFLDI
jgi:hypothetical protein